MADVPTERTSLECPRWNELAERLADPKFRRSFLGNPQEALGGAGLNAEELPEELLDALAELTPTELRLLGDLVNRFQIVVGQSNCIF